MITDTTRAQRCALCLIENVPLRHASGLASCSSAACPAPAVTESRQHPSRLRMAAFSAELIVAELSLQEELAAAYAALEVADKRAAELQSGLEQAAASHPEVMPAATGLLPLCPSLTLPNIKGAQSGPRHSSTYQQDMQDLFTHEHHCCQHQRQ